MGSDLPLKILFIVPYTPNLIRTRPLNLIKGLAAVGHRLTVATLWSSSDELESLQKLAGIPDGMIAERIGTIHSGWNCARALAGLQPMQACHSWSPRLMKKISGVLNTGNYDVVHVEHLRGVKYGLGVNSIQLSSGQMRPQVVWDSVDCISNLFEHASQESTNRLVRLIARMELPRTERFEGWLTTQFARVLVTSDTDRNGLLRLTEIRRRRNGHASTDFPEERIAVVPNGVDLTYFCPPDGPREPQTLVISGKMSYHANVTAVVRFVKNVMPKIWDRLPKTRLWIVGKDPSPEICSLGIPAKQISGASINGNGDARIQITGTVDDVRPYLWGATVSVAPIRYGVGIQNKVLEAMACGTPVVATPEAVKALHVRCGHHLVVESDEQKMADSICSLLTDPKRCLDLGREARSFVEANHDWNLTVRELSRIYRHAIS